MILCVTQGKSTIIGINYQHSRSRTVRMVKRQIWCFWQIIPMNLSELLSTGTRKQINAVTEEFLQMKKII